MGVLERLSQLFNRNKVKALNAPQQSIHEQNFLNGIVSFPTSNPGEHITIREIRFINQINHSNGKINNLMLAKVAIGKTGEKEVLDSGESVLFEAEQGSIGNESLLQKIAYYYLYEKRLPENQQKDCYYVGELNNNPKDTFMRKSDFVQQYVDSQIAPQLSASKAIKELERQAILRQRFDIAMQNLQVRKADNLVSNSIYIKQRRLHDEEYEKKYHDYDATKTDTGTVLRIRKLKKVAKDTNGRYIYTAFLKDAHSEDEAEKIYSQYEIPDGIPVCFTLDGRIEDIVQAQNPNEMKPILDMLSARETFDRRRDRLNYIGNVDRAGNINRDMYSNSRIISDKIQSLQKEFFEERQNNEQERN